MNHVLLADASVQLVLRGLWNGFKALAVALWHGLKATAHDVWIVRPRHLNTVYSISYLLGMIIFVVILVLVYRRLRGRRVLVRRRVRA
jgi:hypothetical protein